MNNSILFPRIYINIHNLKKRNLNRFIELIFFVFFFFFRPVSTIGCTWIIRFGDSRREGSCIGNFSNGWPNCRNVFWLPWGEKNVDPKVVLFCRVTVERCISRETFLQSEGLLLYTGYFHGFSGFQTFLGFSQHPRSGHLYRLAGKINGNPRPIKERKRILRREERET